MTTGDPAQTGVEMDEMNCFPKRRGGVVDGCGVCDACTRPVRKRYSVRDAVAKANAASATAARLTLAETKALGE